MFASLVLHVHHPNLLVHPTEASTYLPLDVECWLRRTLSMLTLSLAFPRIGIRLCHGSRVFWYTAPSHTLTCAHAMNCDIFLRLSLRYRTYEKTGINVDVTYGVHTLYKKKQE